MGIELSGAGETLAAIVVSNELSKDGGGNGSHDGANKTNCANCGATLQGKYCHDCGQSGHIHRSLLHMFEEVLHGLFHFDTKAWRTIPALIFRPGKLTKEYIEGKRTSYVSPLALFLFLIFLMFFVFSFTAKDIEKDILNTTETREEIVKEIASTTETLAKQELEQAELVKKKEANTESLVEIHDSKNSLRLLQEKLDKLDNKPKTTKEYQAELELTKKNLEALKAARVNLLETAGTNAENNQYELNTNEQLIGFAEKDVKRIQKKIDKLDKEALKSGIKESLGAKGNSKSANGENTIDITSGAKNNSVGTSVEAEISDLSDYPWLEKMVSHVEANKALTLYKMKKNASSYAFLLMPISLPFLWLLFMFRRQYVMFDHAVFSLYSLSFMCILLMVIAILSRFEFVAIASMLFTFVPPIHMFTQLRGAYSLGILATLWRTVALLFIAMLSLSLYAVLITVLSA